MSQFFNYDPTTGIDTFNFAGSFMPTAISCTGPVSSTGPATFPTATFTDLSLGSDSKKAVINSSGKFISEPGQTVGSVLLQNMNTTPQTLTSHSTNASQYSCVFLCSEPAAGTATYAALNFMTCQASAGVQNISGSGSTNITVTNTNASTLNVALPGGKALVFTFLNGINIQVALAANPATATYLSVKWSAVKAVNMLTP